LYAMIAVLSLLCVLVISLIVLRIGAVALVLTGLSEHVARFQALSAFTGVGFTTHEAELVVNHPVRRRILMTLMLLGQAGVVTAVTSLLLSFIPSSDGAGWAQSRWLHFTVLVVGVSVVAWAAHSRHLDRWMSRVIAWALRRYTSIEVRDYAALLHLARNYAVSELAVREHDWMAGKTLRELQLSSEGVLVLGIEKADGAYIGAPRGDNHIEPGDTVILYGRQDKLERLDRRPSGYEGNIEHMLAIDEQLDEEAEGLRMEEEYHEHVRSGKGAGSS